MWSSSRTTDAGFAAAAPLDAKARPAAAMIDEAAFQAFFQETASPLRGYVVSVLGGAAAADDIVQEAFLRLLRSAPPRDQMRPLLFRIAGNLIADHWRRLRRQPLAADQIPDRPATPRDIGLRLDMARTFQRLSPQQRQLLWLAYVEGADHQEIARALGLRPLSVRVLLFRARRKLAQLIDQEPPREGVR